MYGTVYYRILLIINVYYCIHNFFFLVIIWDHVVASSVLQSCLVISIRFVNLTWTVFLGHEKRSGTPKKEKKAAARASESEP